MYWPQITMIVLFAVSFTVHLLKHGESSGTYNAPFAAVFLSFEVFVLYCGGFFG